MANPLRTVSQSAFRINADSVSGLIEAALPDCSYTPRLRRHVRISSNIKAILYTETKFQSVIIRNISLGGAGLANCSCVLENDSVVLCLLSGRRIEAKVRWWLAGVCGVQFIELLEPNDILLTGRLGYTEYQKSR